MKHARDDYAAIQDPRGLIPEDEPVFLLRAQDVCLGCGEETVEKGDTYCRQDSQTDQNFHQ